MSDLKRKIGLRLREIRKAKGWTQEHLAGLINRSVYSVSQMERGVSAPSAETLIRLREAYSLSIDEILNLEKIID